MAMRAVNAPWAPLNGLPIFTNELLPEDRVIGLKRTLSLDAIWPWRVALKGEQAEALMMHPVVAEQLKKLLPTP